jgi:hypothetical protein
MDIDPGSYDDKMLNGPVGRFGRYVVERGYAPGVAAMESSLSGKGVAPDEAHLRGLLATLSADQADAVRELVKNALLEALHGLTHGISHDTDAIQVLFEGQDVAALSDGLHGDLLVWLATFSEHGPAGSRTQI